MLAEQDAVLGRLVDESDAVLAPLAERRKALGGFIEHAGDTAAATAERRATRSRRTSRSSPASCASSKPAADRFGALASEMTPAVRTLADQAPAVNASIARLGPFSEAATPAVKTLGDLADRGRRTFPEIEPLVDDLGALGKPLEAARRRTSPRSARASTRPAASRS